ncbi:MAG: adenylate/guanylate cyclase domain-containing protein [Arenimonas sp.]
MFATARTTAMQNFYQQTLIWQKETMVAAGSNVTAIIHLYCKFLAAQDIHLCRANVALMTLHPQIEAIRFVWHNSVITPDPVPSPTMFYRKVHYLDDCTIDEAHLPFGAKSSIPFQKSPFWRLVEGEEFLSYEITPGKQHEYGVLDDLAKVGATHYIATRLSGNEAYISLVSNEVGGFTPEEITFIKISLTALSLLIESAVKDLVLDTVLSCYVGYSPGDEIKQGNIRPGSMMDMEGAIWFSDIRKYSTHSQNTEAVELAEKLNAYYDIVVNVIYAHEGEILKFIGDAILAIFPINEAINSQQVCQNAVAAAMAANKALKNSPLNFEHGVGLHVGRFQYGNIGSLRRMDFTAIGNEVNIASRIESQCSTYKLPLLMSEKFVKTGDIPAQCFAKTALKGMTGEHSLYVPNFS